MKELQSQLREKEEEVRGIQRQREKEAKEREEHVKKLSKENHRLEREKWELLKRARDAAERSLNLRSQLDMKEGSLRAAQVELERTRDELMSVKSANTSLRALLSDLRAPKSSVDASVQVDISGTLRRNRSIELAITRGGMSQDQDSGFERSCEFRSSCNTLGESLSERWERAESVTSSIYDPESRETTPIPTPFLSEKKGRKKKPPLFGKMRKGTGRRGTSVGEFLSSLDLRVH